jgi:3-oxoacyl-[acyl-carrier-protein] synthase III
MSGSDWSARKSSFCASAACTWKRSFEHVNFLDGKVAFVCGEGAHDPPLEGSNSKNDGKKRKSIALASSWFAL